MTGRKKLTRRDRCYCIGVSAQGVTDKVGARAWRILGMALECLELKDVPKFEDLLEAIRNAHLRALREETHQAQVLAEEFPYQCPKCKHRFANPESLGNPFFCPDCNKLLKCTSHE